VVCFFRTRPTKLSENAEIHFTPSSRIKMMPKLSEIFFQHNDLKVPSGQASPLKSSQTTGTLFALTRLARKVAFFPQLNRPPSEKTERPFTSTSTPEPSIEHPCGRVSCLFNASFPSIRNQSRPNPLRTKRPPFRRLLVFPPKVNPTFLNFFQLMQKKRHPHREPQALPHEMNPKRLPPPL